MWARQIHQIWRSHTHISTRLDSIFLSRKSRIILENSKSKNSFWANVNLVQSCTHWVIAPQSSTQLFIQIFKPLGLNTTRPWFATLWMKKLKSRVNIFHIFWSHFHWRGVVFYHDLPLSKANMNFNENTYRPNDDSFYFEMLF